MSLPAQQLHPTSHTETHPENWQAFDADMKIFAIVTMSAGIFTLGLLAGPEIMLVAMLTLGISTYMVFPNEVKNWVSENQPALVGAAIGTVLGAPLGVFGITFLMSACAFLGHVVNQIWLSTGSPVLSFVSPIWSLISPFVSLTKTTPRAEVSHTRTANITPKVLPSHEPDNGGFLNSLWKQTKDSLNSLTQGFDQGSDRFLQQYTRPVLASPIRATNRHTDDDDNDEFFDCLSDVDHQNIAQPTKILNRSK